MNKTAYFGTSTWTYPGWEGIVYQDVSSYGKQFKSECLSEYARSELFDCVGIDSTFYGVPSEQFLANLRRQLPSGFPCIFKVPREISSPRFTHSFGPKGSAGNPNPHYLNPVRLREGMLKICREMMPANEGLFVMQFPTLRQEDIQGEKWLECLDDLLGELGGEWPIGVEIRNPELLSAAYFEVLGAHRATHMFQVWTGMPLPHDVLAKFPESIRCSDLVGCRALVRPGLHYSDAVEKYSPYSRLVDPAPQIRESILTLVDEAELLNKAVITTVNNRLEGCAPLTIQALRQDLQGRR